MADLNDMFLHYLQDMYYAERQVTKALPKLAKAAQNQGLKDMFIQSRGEKPQHIEQMKHLFELVGKRPRGITCEAMDGLIEEADELLEEHKEPSPARDAALIASAQAMAHYGIARYGTMAAWAKVNGNGEAAQVLQQMLDANKSADEHLNELAEATLNPQAAAGGEGEDDEEEEEMPEEAEKPKRSRGASSAKPAGKGGSSSSRGGGRGKRKAS